MKIAIIGSGGREQALAWKFAQTMGRKNVFILSDTGKAAHSFRVRNDDFEAIYQFCQTNEITYIFVGAETPLKQGIVDYFRKTSIQILGATQKAAQLESSKIFAKQFMQKHGVCTAAFQAFESVAAAQQWLEKQTGGWVVKYDGLAAGKGVWVGQTMVETKAALAELAARYGANSALVIEQKLVGNEISMMGFVDGKTIKLLLPSQDHKALLDNDKGANTGGMGAVCPLPFWSEELENEIQNKIIKPTLKGIQTEEMDYRGVLYFGIILCEEGAYLLEYNVRLGDPETEVLLMALQSDLMPIVQACIEQRLMDIDLKFNKGYFVDVVQVSGGYPHLYQKKYPIKGLSELEDVQLFEGAMELIEGQYCTAGGRVLHLVGQGETLAAAIQKTYKECQKISFQDNFYRKDIGQRALKGELLKDNWK